MTFFENFFTSSRSTNGLISCSAKSKLKLPEFVYITHVVVPVCLKIKSSTHVQLFLAYSVIRCHKKSNLLENHQNCKLKAYFENKMVIY